MEGVEPQRVPLSKRIEYWNHFITTWVVRKRGGAYGLTGPKLRKVEKEIFADDSFWEDIVNRHDGRRRTPFEMYQQEPAIYEHCEGNFWGGIAQTLLERGLIK